MIAVRLLKLKIELKYSKILMLYKNYIDLADATTKHG